MTGLEILAIILGVVGIVGSIVPGLPGPPVSWVGLLLLYIGKSGGIGLGFLMLWLVITIVITILDFVIPAWTTKVTGGHKAASTGALIGLFAGMFLTPIGAIAGALAGAVLGELMVTDEGAWPAFKAGFGAFLGFLLGTFLKIAASGLMLFYIIKLAV